MHRLRNRLIAAFFAATIVPLFATIWITTSLLERSLDYATTEELDRLSRSLEETVREFYRRDRLALREAVEAGDVAPTFHDAAAPQNWPTAVEEFWNGTETDRFQLSGPGGDRLDYLRREKNGVSVYTRVLGGIRMEEVSDDFREARALVDSMRSRDLQRGFTLTLILLVAGVWCVSLGRSFFWLTESAVRFRN